MKLLGFYVCTPAVVYLVISILLLLYVLFSLSNVMGMSVWIWAFINVLVILFWTFILNCVCVAGYKPVTWILVLFPIAVILFNIMNNSY